MIRSGPTRWQRLMAGHLVAERRLHLLLERIPVVRWWQRLRPRR